MYVCICNAVTDREIRRAREAGVESLSELSETLGVASCCGSCAEHAEAILSEPEPRKAPSRPRLYVPTAA